MKIMIIGLGSMGKRRLRLILKNYEEVSVIGVDSRLDRREEVAQLFSVEVFEDLNTAIKLEKPDVAFICTSPVSHAELTQLCLNERIHIFSEINLINENYDNLIRLAVEKKLDLFLSSTPLYRKEIQSITNLVLAIKQPVNYIYHVGQYLPDWHPWENYEGFFVGNKKTNGCREILCIELPWMVNAFGEIENVQVTKGKNSKLKIEFNDNYLLTITHKNGNKGIFAADVISRKAIRNLEIYNENIHIQWLGTPDTLFNYNFQKQEMEAIRTYDKVNTLTGYNDSIIENMYEEEIACFFDCLNKKEKPKYSFEKDKLILDIVDRIEGE